MSCPRHADGESPPWCMDCHPERYAKYFEAAPPPPPPPPPPAPASAGDDWDPDWFGYESFITKSERDTYLYVKKLEQDVARAARSVLAELCSGTIGDGARSKKQFLNTRHGRFRVSCRDNSDNTTETAANFRLGATKLNAGSRKDALVFLGLHDVQMTYREFVSLVVAEMGSMR